MTELNPSVHKVFSDEDLLTEILLRLPVLSLLQFKIVSKTWLSIIKSSNFTLLRNQNPKLDPPSGIFRMQDLRLAYNFLRVDTLNKSPVEFCFPFRSESKEYLQITNSCNGLLLCFIKPFKLFVYNPSTNQFRLLPEHHYSELAKHMFIGVKLAFDPTKACHYKVIYAGEVYDGDVNRSIQISIYSSETGCWSVCGNRFSSICFEYFHQGIYWNGAIHWLDPLGLHYKLDVDNLVLATISKPGTLDGNLHHDFYRKLFVSRGCLDLVCTVVTISTKKQQLNVYERNGCSEWSPKYVIDIDDFEILIPGIWKIAHPNQIFVRCIVEGEKEEDSFLVLDINGKIVQYNVSLKTVSKIYEFCPPHEGFFSRQCFPFIPSLAGV